MPISVNADPWPPYVYGTPVNGVVTAGQNQFRPSSGACAVIAKRAADETFWNGTEFVPLEDFGMPTSFGEPPEGAIVATAPHTRLWQVTVPWSVIGAGSYNVYFFKSSAPGNGYYFAYPFSTQPVRITGPRSNNPDGVTVDSSFGSTDALRVLDPDDNPVEGVHVVAKVTVTEDGGSVTYTRATATTDAEGRWAFDRVLQPGTVHAVTFSKAGYTIQSTTITTGNNS